MAAVPELAQGWIEAPSTHVGRDSKAVQQGQGRRGKISQSEMTAHAHR